MKGEGGGPGDAGACGPCARKPERSGLPGRPGCGLKPVALVAGEGHLSRTVVEHMPGGGVRRHPLCQVAEEADGRISVTPFSGERHSTLYHDRPLHLWRSARLLCEEA